MNKKLSFWLLIYGVILLAIGGWAMARSPHLAGGLGYASLAGGALCLVWGLRAGQGKKTKAGAVLTLIPLGYLFMAQAIQGWLGGGGVVAERLALAASATLGAAITLAMLLRVAYDGVLFGVAGNSGQNKSLTHAGPGGGAGSGCNKKG